MGIGEGSPATHHHQHQPAMATATRVRKLHSETFVCPFCSGKGKLPHFSHIQNGDCFACGATGKVRDLTAFIGDNSDLMLTVWVNRGKFTGATLRRRTWRIVTTNMTESGFGRKLGRDAFTRNIDDAEEAREIWRNAKRLGIITTLMAS